MKARIVNIQRFSLHDGPGIRTVVFFKGCSLRCLWCANPECINLLPELGFSKILCNQCGDCFPVCTEGALVPDKDGTPVVNRSLCTNCGECVSSCPQKALVIYGNEVTLEELFEEICRDRVFYTHSEGGVTASGGEPVLQSDFILALFKMCRDAKIATAIETCGYVSSDAFRKVLEYTDFVLYDLKLIDNQRHLNMTSKPNDKIIDNAHIVADMGVQVQFRMPIIPGLNDDFENIETTSEFLHQLGADTNFSIELMPYHRLGVGKYEALGQVYSLKEIQSATPDLMELVRQRFEEQGIACLVSS